MAINKVMLTGNLTRDPELRCTAQGTSVLSFGIAVNERRKNRQTDEWEDYPNFVNCNMFGNRADAVSRFISKGSKVAVEGRLRFSQWEDKETGKNRSKLEVIVDEIEFMQSRNEAKANDDQYYETYDDTPSEPSQSSIYDEEIPF